MRIRWTVACLVVTVLTAVSPRGQAGTPPLGSGDVDAIAELLMLEDTRRFDEAVLTRLLRSSHQEVRRRAVMAVGRIADERGRALLAPLRTDANAEIVATVAFATGQLDDADAVPWLGEQLSSPTAATAVAREAAIALGKIPGSEARTALAAYLASAPMTAAPDIVGSALLSIGRFASRDDIAPIVRWTSARDVEVRWRAAWALFRPRNPAAVPHLMRLASDSSPDVRYWAVRGVVPPAPAGRRGRGEAASSPAPQAAAADPSFDLTAASAILRRATRDSDRRVRTEAVRALAFYTDDESVAALIAALNSSDTWVSVSAAEALGNARFQARAADIVPLLMDAAGPTKPSALRSTALTPLVGLAPEQAVSVATALARDRSAVIRGAARQALGRLGDPGRAALAALGPDPAAPAATGGRARGQAPAADNAAPVRTLADYRRIVERWILPDYRGVAKPRASWDTTRGRIEIELYPADAPLATEYFVHAVESGAVVGTEFGRVVPNFVAQQRPIRDAARLRDEVNRRGLTRGNVSWASSGLDTGRPGYTLATAPHPHIEGDFTALGRIVGGMDVVDRLELGDAVTAARMSRLSNEQRGTAR
jgi:HEAT repeat protein/cyclophilin family peptidyl-prolyl cis-trans isomerase